MDGILTLRIHEKFHICNDRHRILSCGAARFRLEAFGLKLKEIVPWGRSYDEYGRMFALSPEALAQPILGCGDGPASFNAVLTRAGGRVVSADPVYRYAAGEIRRRIDETAREVMEQVHRRLDRYEWTSIAGPEALYRTRMAAMETFLSDYEAGRRAGRYVPASLPDLPFPGNAFALALCSHLLFTYSAHLDGAFHQAAIEEMLRIAPEVRIFPLLTLDGQPSGHVDAVLATLSRQGHRASVEIVDYAFQRGGNQMLRIRRGE